MDLVRRAQAGSTSAFGELSQHFIQPLMRFFLLRGLLHHEAEDTVQDTLLNAFKYIQSFRQEYRFSTWLFAIAQRNFPSHRDFSAEDLPEPTQGADGVWQAQLRRNIWWQARQALNEQQFTALWLHYGEGFTGKEIARIMEKTNVWVKVSLHRSRQQLRKTLEDWHPEELQHDQAVS